MHDVSVANTVVQVLEGGLHVAQNQYAELQLQLNKQKNEINLLKLAQTHQMAVTSYKDNDSTISWQLTAMTAKAELAKLQAKYHQLLLV